jgi:hypothetical protein
VLDVPSIDRPNSKAAYIARGHLKFPKPSPNKTAVYAASDLQFTHRRRRFDAAGENNMVFALIGKLPV